MTLAAGAQIDDGQVRRNFLTTSACGVCGKASIEAIRVRARYDVAADQARVDPRVLTRLPGRLHDAQRVFARTGGLHAAGAFGADGTLLALREDVGRHNAVDKVVGWALREGRLPLAGCILLVSGRASFELVQKALVAGMPIVAAVSAPSSLAAELADEAGMTLVGFLRGGSMNVYTGVEPHLRILIRSGKRAGPAGPGPRVSAARRRSGCRPPGSGRRRSRPARPPRSCRPGRRSRRGRTRTTAARIAHRVRL